jgi:hypothetical protein
VWLGCMVAWYGGIGWSGEMDGVVARRVCQVILVGEDDRNHDVVCSVAVLRWWCEMVNMQTALLPSVSFCDPGRKFHASYSGSNGGW